MNEQELQVFIDGTVNYFNKNSKDKAEVGSPYLVKEFKSNRTLFSASIGISGKFQGMVYLFAPKTMLASLLKDIGETEYTNEYAADLAGEAANTIAGNARKYFGKDFMISVPAVHIGDEHEILLNEGLKTYAVPINWKEHKSILLISI